MCTLLVVCGWSDLRCRKVANVWLAAGALAGTGLRGMTFVIPAAAILILSFVLFRSGLMGGADGKLMAVIAGYLGLYEGVVAIGFGMVAGVCWFLCFHLHTQCISVRFKRLSAYIRQLILTGKTTSYYLNKSHPEEDTIPLAACLAAGTGVYLLVLGR